MALTSPEQWRLILWVWDQLCVSKKEGGEWGEMAVAWNPESVWSPKHQPVTCARPWHHPRFALSLASVSALNSNTAFSQSEVNFHCCLSKMPPVSIWLNDFAVTILYVSLFLTHKILQLSPKDFSSSVLPSFLTQEVNISRYIRSLTQIISVRYA